MTEQGLPLKGKPDVTVGYLHDNDWFRFMSLEQYNAARIKLRQELQMLDPRQPDSSESAVLTLVPQASEGDLENLGEALVKLNKQNAEAATEGVKILNGYTERSGADAFMVETSQLRHLCVRSRENPRIHLNAMTCPLHRVGSTEGVLGERVTVNLTEIESRTEPVQIVIQITWECEEPTG